MNRYVFSQGANVKSKENSRKLSFVLFISTFLYGHNKYIYVSNTCRDNKKKNIFFLKPITKIVLRTYFSSCSQQLCVNVSKILFKKITFTETLYGYFIPVNN